MTHGREIKVNDDVEFKTVLGRKFYLQTVVFFLALLLILLCQLAITLCNGWALSQPFPEPGTGQRGEAAVQSLIDKHLIKGVYHIIVESDLNQAEQEFQAILAMDKNHVEAYYFLGRVYYERVLSSSAPRSMLREAEKYLRMAHSLGIVYDKLHPNLLGYNGYHRSSNSLITILEGFSPEIVAEVTQHQGTGRVERDVKSHLVSAGNQAEGPLRSEQNEERGMGNFPPSIQGNSEKKFPLSNSLRDEFRYLSQPEVMPQASRGKAVATLFLETGRSEVSDIQILSADALGLTRKRVYEPDAPVELVSGTKYRVEFGSKRRSVKILTPLAIMGVGVVLLLMR